MTAKISVSKQHTCKPCYDSTIFVSQIPFLTHLFITKNNLMPDYSMF